MQDRYRGRPLPVAVRNEPLSPRKDLLKYALRYFILSLPMLPLAVPNPCYSRFDLRRSFFPVSASQTIGEKFPNLRVRGRILCSKNIISPDVYGPPLSPFLLLFTNIHRSILVYSFAERNTKISTRSRNRVERFVSLRLPRCPR